MYVEDGDVPGTTAAGTGGDTPADTGSATAPAGSSRSPLVGLGTMVDFDAIPRNPVESLRVGPAGTVGAE